jgi:preprotein translocase subunit SecF
MNKRSLHHLWAIIRPVKIWYLSVLLLMFASVTVLALRDNNLTMIKLRQEVYAADEKNTNVEGALHELRKYVYGHMNTDLSTGNEVYPPIQLKSTYQRLKQAEKDRVSRENARIYTDAQAYCEQQNPTGFSGRGRVSCIEQYVTAHGTLERSIPDAMYKFDFVSATWSPDLAGFSLLASILMLVLLVLRAVAGQILKSLSK